MYAKRNRVRGKPKNKQLNVIESYVKRAGISVVDAEDRVKRKLITMVTDLK